MNHADMDSSYCSFWPRPVSDIHLSVLDISPERLFTGKLAIVAAGRRLRLLANCLHTIGALGVEGGIVEPLLEEAALEILAIATECPGEEGEQLRRVAQYVRGRFRDRELLPACAGYVEREVFLLFGPLSTWYNKTKERRISFVMGRPDNELCQFISDVVNGERLVAWLRQEYQDQQLRLATPLPQVCFLDLAFCGGESDMFPKHYAYFLPENGGYPKAARKKTVVFENVYKDKFDKISRKIGRHFIHGFAADGTPSGIRNALSAWIRAHDLGHYIQYPGTNWRRLSERDYVWSMACQELLADLVGYSYLLDPGTIDATGLTRRAMTDVLTAEMLRYAAGGPRATPDSMSANWELSWLFDRGALRVVNGMLFMEWEEFYKEIKTFLAATAGACLATDAEEMYRLTGRLTPRDETAGVIASASKVECFQVYSTSL